MKNGENELNTNLEHAKQHVDSIRLEIEKGMEGGFCCDHYLKEKIYQLMKTLEMGEKLN